ncbi:TPA: multidrug effflux MFS transporter [Klebsiella pneumoniae]|nr:multidrug effflux MFS transporter [Klebsiella pneumoniae]HCD5545946.1 multidrug effflux MFS transporter [Klebsiella pneumoniae]
MARVSLSWALILGLLSGIGPLCTDFYLPALPEITQQLQATSTQTQLSLTAALIGLGLGQLFFGPLSDHIGRLKPLALSLLLFIFSSAMCALTRDINMLIVWRFLQGFAGAGGSVLSRSIARDKYQGTLLTQFFALLMTVNGIAPVLSPVLGGYVITAFDWRILFWTMAAIGGVLLVMSLAILRETRPATAAHASRQRPGQPVLKNRRFLRFCLIQAFMMAGLFSYIGSSSFVMQSEYGMSAMQFSLLFGLLFGLNGIGLIIAAMFFSRLARRFSAESLLRGGLTLAVSCAAIMLLFAWLHLPVLALVGLFFTVSLMSGISTVAGAEAMSAVDAAQSGTASALMGTLMFVFGGIAAPLAGLGGETMLKMSLAMAICYLLALLLGLSKPRDAR